MRRRDFITLVGGGAVAWPLVAHAQQAAMPVIGFLHSGSPEPNARRLAGFRKGLSDAGLVEGKNVAIEFRWAQGKDDRLPELAADLIRQRVAVIATLSSTTAAVAAKAATSTIPIYFLIADPPVELGLVTSLNRPGGNATGITTLAAELAAKRLSLLYELVPQAASMAALVKPSHPSAKPVTQSLQATARTLGVQLNVLEASSDHEIEAAYAALKPRAALLVATDPFFFVRRAQLVALSARHAVPTIYDSREFAEAGGPHRRERKGKPFRHSPNPGMNGTRRQIKFKLGRSLLRAQPSPHRSIHGGSTRGGGASNSARRNAGMASARRVLSRNDTNRRDFIGFIGETAGTCRATQ
jgi:putative ABC transport system substrate-binding protein